MSANGGIIGPDNVPTASVASGVWSLAEAFDAQTAGDPYWDNVSLLINCDGGSITDVSRHTATVGTSGDPTASTTSPKFGSHSINLDGNDYLTNPTSSHLNIQSGDWTIEYWMRFPSGASWSTAGQLVFGQGINTSDFWHISNHWSTTSDIYFAVRDGGSTWSTSVVSSSGAVDQSSTDWHHYAFSNASNTLKIFKNGTEIGSGTFTGNADIVNNFFIGTGYGTGGQFTAAQNHYIDDFRLTKGVARYTSNFIVPDATFQTGNTPWPLGYNVDTLIIAGGGGGGGNQATNYPPGGGGAGGFRYFDQTTALAIGTSYTVTVGAGGAGGASGENMGITGSNSVFSGGSLTSAGGGGGASSSGSSGVAGLAGGSGGGGSRSDGAGGAGNTPSTSPSQGNAGGAGRTASDYGGGGGGGAGAVGGAGGVVSVNTAGAGGAGTSNSITGGAVTYAGGGGGAGYAQVGGPAGSGGGGVGGGTGGVAGAGTANLGGGGGGAKGNGSKAGAAGGSGVVILSIPTHRYSGTSSGSPTVSTSGGNTILKFTSSGAYTA